MDYTGFAPQGDSRDPAIIKVKKEAEIISEQHETIKDLVTNELSFARAIASRHGLTLEQVERLLSDPEFMQDLELIWKSSKRASFYLDSYTALIQIVRTGRRELARLQAIRLLRDLLGEASPKVEKKEVTTEEVASLESALRKADEETRRHATGAYRNTD